MRVPAASGTGVPAVALMVAVARTAERAIRSTGDALAPWLELMIRFWLAQVFLAGAAVAIMSHDPPAMAGDGAWVSRFNGLVASPFGVLIQTVCPILLLLGFSCRAATIPLLIQVWVLHGPAGPSHIHLFWSALLGWLLVLGPGPVSVDAVLTRGLDSTAIPGATRLRTLFGWMERRIGPWYRLALRLWMATAPLAGAGASLGWAAPARDAAAPWLAALPDRIASLPAGLSLALGAFLAVGLGTRLCALVLMLAIPVADVGMTFDDRLYWTLLLAILVCRGAGRFALDGSIAGTVTALGGRMLPPLAGLPHVVIVGGGFGGVTAARGLKGAPCRVTLVDRRNYHLFQPLLYQVATAGLSPADIATPIRSLFRGQDNLRVLLAEVRDVSAATSEVVLDHGQLSYDYLVLATGSQHSYFGRDDWAPDAPGLKRLEDATDIRRRLLIAFERAENATHPAERAAFMSFVIVGGGPTGVELAGAIAELARNGLSGEFREIDPAAARVIVVQSGPRILPTFSESLAADATTELSRLGVEIRTGGKVQHVDASGVTVDGLRIEARTILWAAGVAASPAGSWLGVPTDRAGRIVVAPDLSVAPHAAIFAIGDTAASTGWRGAPVPGLAPAAKQGGAYAAKVIRSRLTGGPAPEPFGYRHAGSLATIGRRAAVAEFGSLRVRGALAWWLWGAAHILFLAGGRNRATVILEWIWAYLTGRRGSRLITEPSPGRLSTDVPADE